MKRNQSFLLFLALLQMAFLSGYSQHKRIKFDHLTTENGLSQSNIASILQDSRGFMWFGTEDGLNRYDGYRIKVYRKDHNSKQSLSNNHVTAITEDGAGNLWIGTLGGGLNMFHREKETFTHYQYDQNNPGSLHSNFINHLIEDRKGNLWIATSDGISCFNRTSGSFEKHEYRENSTDNGTNSITKLFIDNKDNFWAGTDGGGLILFDREKKTMTTYEHDDHNINSLSTDVVWDIFQDSRGSLWIATYGGGLDRFDYETGEFEHLVKNEKTSNSLPDNVVFAIAEDNNGNLWIGTENTGISVFDPASGSFQNYIHSEYDHTGLNSSSINCIYKDAKGSMWIGTYNSGLNVFNSEASKFVHYKHDPSVNSLSNSNVLCIYEDSDQILWIGTDGGGLNSLNRKTGVFTKYTHQKGKTNSICGDHVLSVFEDSEKNLWIGTFGNGLTRWNRKKNTFKHFSGDSSDPSGFTGGQNVWLITEDRDKNLWVGLREGGVNRYNPSTETFTHFDAGEAGFSSDVIQCLQEVGTDYIWIGTMNDGLNMFNKKTNEIVHFKHDEYSNSISSDNIKCMYEDKLGDLWIGTSGGLNRLDMKTKSFTTYYKQEGLPSDFIQGILADSEGNLWISTNNGLSRFNPEEQTFKKFGVADGLQSSGFTSAHYESSSGAMYFGGTNGFNEFFPDEIKEMPFDPPIVLTGLQIFNKPVPIGGPKGESPLIKSITETKDLTLSHEHSVVSFDFASLNYIAQEKKEYAYKLDGFDKTWNYIKTQHSATYTNLDPGEYVFNVKGLNNEGNWSQNIATLKVTVTPPLWETFWFRGLSIILILGAIFSIHRIREKSILRQKVELEKQIKLRTEEILMQKEDLITQSKYLENNNIELIAQRVEIIHQREDAERARSEAEAANRAKSVFLATMSHEIRTPMNGVIGMASLLAETSLSDEQREYNETIRNCGESLLGVINDILDFSKIESGKMELEKSDFDLRGCIEEVLDVFAGKAAKGGVDLIYQLDYDVPPQLVGDSLRLRQILLNLVGNAVKFTHQGEIFTSVHLLKREGDDVEIGFSVRDTGIGIPQDKLKRLFTAFSQVDSSTTRKYGGTGLGLAISLKLVHLMGGTIKVESTPGQGTTFTFTINTSVSVTSLPTYVNCAMNGLEGKRILVVDDNATNRDILKGQLENWKLETTLASSGNEALEILSKSGKFDLVLSDMQMPEMDGIGLAKFIRKSYGALPIILLSSIGDEHGKNYSDLFSSVLTKPVKQNMLCKHILQQLRQSGKPVLTERNLAPKLSVDFSRQHPLRILVAEDNVVNQKLTERVLSKLGYKPVTVINGQQALDAAKQQLFDLILMDVQMPEMDGLESTKQIRRSEIKQPIIIAMTANAMQGDKDLCIGAGMDDYISKPVRLETLINMLEKWSAHLVNQRV